MPDETHLGQVRLRTRTARRVLDFYEQVLGLKVVGRAGVDTELSGDGTNPASIVLSEDPTAAECAPKATGLFHVAIRYATRQALAGVCFQLLKSRYPLEGASDHNVSEAVYLSDPDGNGVELYADRPRAEWMWRDGQVAMSTRTLDLESLLTEAGQRSRSTTWPRPEIGHIHLRVSNLGPAEHFYHEFLGLAVTQHSYPGALFFSAGGYHHHVAVNTWGSPVAAAPHRTGLISYRFIVPVPEILYCLKNRAPLFGYEAEMPPQTAGQALLRLRDPNGTWLEVVSE